MAYRGAGGTDGGQGSFLLGLIMMIGGGYLLLKSIIVRPTFGLGMTTFNAGGVPVTSGMILIVFMLGVLMIFYNSRNWIGWILAVGSIIALIFGVIAVVLAAVGIYGVVSYAGELRTDEMATRLALGASPGDVFRLVMKQGVTLGVIGLVLGGVFLALYRQPPSREVGVSTERPPVMPVRSVLLNPTLLATGWSFFAFGWVLFFAVAWLPGYLEQTWSLDLKSVGWSSTLPWAIALLLMPIAGWISDAIMARTGSVRSARVHLIWICQALAVVCFIPVIFVHSVGWAVAFISLAIGFSMAPNSPYYSICADLFRGRTGLATGMIVTFFSLSGVLCPVITGWLAEAGGGFAAAFTALCVVVGSGVLGMLVFASGRPPIEVDPI